jgi:hypothetical protein
LLNVKYFQMEPIVDIARKHELFKF